VDGWSRGAPIQACGTTTDIVPNHSGTLPSTNPLLFSVDLSNFKRNMYTPSQTYTSKYIHCVHCCCDYHHTVTMLGGENNTDFKGFMIQGRVLADDSHTGAFGTGTYYQPQCDTNVSEFYCITYLCWCVCTQTAATHTNDNEKSSVSLSWTAPPAGTGAIRFR